MSFKIVCLLFTILSVGSVNAQEQVVTLQPDVARFYLDSFYKGQRDSLLLKSCTNREKIYDERLLIKDGQISSYKRDSTTNHKLLKNLRAEKKNSLDSLTVKKDEKIARVKKNGAIKNWIIVILAVYGLSRTL